MGRGGSVIERTTGDRVVVFKIPLPPYVLLPLILIHAWVH